MAALRSETPKLAETSLFRKFFSSFVSSEETEEKILTLKKNEIRI